MTLAAIPMWSVIGKRTIHKIHKSCSQKRGGLPADERGQAVEDPSEITLRYLTGQAELFLAIISTF